MADDLSGTTIAGRYQIVGLIGLGRIGAVYRAIDLHRGEIVALKVLRKGILDRQEHQSLLAEARILERLHGPNLVRIYDYGEAGDATYIATEYVEGRSLAEILRAAGKPLDVRCAVEILRQIGKALEYVHHNGLLHRDIKPSNILVSKQGKVLLADFGLATHPGPQLTTIGTIVGTPAYMSPEQAMGQAIDARSDVFSLAAVIYESITGRRPFEGRSIDELLRSVVEMQPASPRHLNPMVDRGLDTALLKALANDPERRFSSVRLFLREIERSRPRFAAEADDAAILLSKLGNQSASPVGSVNRTVGHGGPDQVTKGKEVTSPPPSHELLNDSPTLETIPYAAEVSGDLARLRSKPTAMAWLLVLNGPLRGQRFQLAETFTIDSSAVGDLVLLDPSVSRRHAQIVLENGRFYIYDVQSRWGTMVNGAHVQRQELRDRDEIRIGHATMLFIHAVSQEDLTEEAKHRLSEFDFLWEELKRSVHHA
jgi:serine/threonine protein kinase